MDWGTVGTLLLAVAALITAIYTLRKLKPEKRVLNTEADKNRADVAKQYQEIAKQSAQREQELMTRIEALETRLDTLEKELEATKKSLGEWQNWAERLAHQLRSRNLIPVPFSLERKTRPPNQK